MSSKTYNILFVCLFVMNNWKLGIVIHTCNSSTYKVEAEELKSLTIVKFDEILFQNSRAVY